jgi:uncharacterized protein (DUF1015 family)
MVELSPFKGITYNQNKIGKLDDVMSPPYDIISSEMQDELYNKHPSNFVRLILGKQHDSDTEEDNRYTRAKAQFDKMLKDAILQSDDTSAIYPYKIEYTVDDEKKMMNGFFILLKLDPEYKLVKAHERTLSKPKADRLNLMRHCYANLEPIQLLYIDDNDSIRKTIDEKLNDPLINVRGYDGFSHSLWRIDDEETISTVVGSLDDKILFIADGHHRYQTAINYAEEMKEKTGNTNDDAPFNYRMVILANMFDEGLSILPTHRFIKKDNVDLEKLIDDLQDYFEIKEKQNDKGKEYQELIEEIKRDLDSGDSHTFVLYVGDKYFVLSLRDESCMNQFADDHSEIWRTLDVSILHKIILEHFLDITQDNLEDFVKYTRSDEEALRFVDEKKFSFSFLMNPTKIDELKAIADAGEHMPQKSTYFLPKMLSGLVMYNMENK